MAAAVSLLGSHWRLYLNWEGIFWYPPKNLASDVPKQNISSWKGDVEWWPISLSFAYHLPTLPLSWVPFWDLHIDGWKTEGMQWYIYVNILIIQNMFSSFLTHTWIFWSQGLNCQQYQANQHHLRLPWTLHSNDFFRQLSTETLVISYLHWHQAPVTASNAAKVSKSISVLSSSA